MKTFRSDIFSAAWAYFKKGVAATFSAALKLAWARYRFIEALKSSVLEFTYRKVDGSIRKAKGTLMGQEVKNINATIVIYFDLEVMALRSFRLQNIV